MLSKSAAIILMETIEKEKFKAFYNAIDCTRSDTDTLFVAFKHAISAIAGNTSQQDFEAQMQLFKGRLFLNTGTRINSLSNDPQQVITNFLKTFSQQRLASMVSEHTYRAYGPYYGEDTNLMLIMNEFLANLQRLNELGNTALSCFMMVESGARSNDSSFNLLPKELRTNISFFATKACIQDEIPNANMEQSILTFDSK